VPAYIPTPEEVNVWSLSGFGHDAINQWIVVGSECRRLVLILSAHGATEKERFGIHWKQSRWQKVDAHRAANRDGYQIWETVSEGSPISRCSHSRGSGSAHGRKAMGADKGSSYETWLCFINGQVLREHVMDANGIRLAQMLRSNTNLTAKTRSQIPCWMIVICLCFIGVFYF